MDELLIKETAKILADKIFKEFGSGEFLRQLKIEYNSHFQKLQTELSKNTVESIRRDGDALLRVCAVHIVDLLKKDEEFIAKVKND